MAESQKLFRRILQEAEEHGIIYDSEEKVFKLKKAERLVFSLEEDSELAKRKPVYVDPSYYEKSEKERIKAKIKEMKSKGRI
jgi:hypothetical protein